MNISDNSLQFIGEYRRMNDLEMYREQLALCDDKIIDALVERSSIIEAAFGLFAGEDRGGGLWLSLRPGHILFVFFRERELSGYKAAFKCCLLFG